MDEPGEILAEISTESGVRPYSRAEIIERCRTDFDFFCATALPEVYTSSFPDFYIAVFWQIVEAVERDRDLSKYAIGIPRAHAKTSFVKFVIAWLLCFSAKKYFLIIGSVRDKAADIITDVMTVMSKPNMVALFGNYNSDNKRDAIHEKTFFFRERQITLMAAGPLGGLVRGTSKNFARPDFILMDDIINEEDAESVAVSDKLYFWMLGTLLLAGNPKNCQYIYLGNKYKGAGCILSKLEADKGWVSLVVGCLLADGEALWPELFTREELLARLRTYIDSNRPEIFFAELMNYVGNENRTNFDFSKVTIFEPPAEYRPEASWLIIDPAGGKGGGDAQAMGHIESWNATAHVKDIIIFKGSSPELVVNALEYCLLNEIPIIFVEGGGFQVTLIQWFNYFIKEKGILGITVVEIPTAGRNKNARIASNLKLLQQKDPEPALTISSKVKSALFAEIRSWNPLTVDNVDDRLDVVAHAGESILKYGAQIVAAQHYGNADQSDSGQLIDIPSI